MYDKWSIHHHKITHTNSATLDLSHLSYLKDAGVCALKEDSVPPDDPAYVATPHPSQAHTLKQGSLQVKPVVAHGGRQFSGEWCGYAGAALGT
jgi:hypothetical protein